MSTEVDLPTGVSSSDLTEKGNALEIQTVSDETEHVPFKFNTDFRPKGPQGNKEGAEARQRARISHLEKIGRGVLADKEFSGNLVMISPGNGGYLFELVRAGEPIPEQEMVPGSEVDLSGIFTPFEPLSKGFSIRVSREKQS